MSSQLPFVNRLAVRITPDALRQVRRGHPWVFDKSIVAVKPAGAPGDLAVIFDDRRRFAAIGLYDPTSPIRIRVLHVGDPLSIDESFWSSSLRAAVERRRTLIDRGDTTGYRIVNGESDGLPGLVIDRYEDVAVVKVYSVAWLPHLAALTRAAVETLGVERVVQRVARRLAHGLDGTSLHGPLPTAPVLFRENGLTFEADVVHGQKTGHFLDQRDNRAKVRALAPGRRVLDVFAATGGFSVHAAAGGATSVHGVDASAPTLAVAARNWNHNTALLGTTEHLTTVGDAFEVLGDLPADSYDLVVVDPPSFAQRADDVPAALHAYRRLARAAARVMTPGGTLVMCSCSSRVTSDAFVAAVTNALEARKVIELERTGHAIDHPATIPEAHYLKAWYARVW